MTETLPIDMDILRNKILEGLTYIHKSINEKEAVLFIGDTGVGKSTLLSYLIGEQLKI
jgi:putative ribosome biogenesis GTPase RsgA